MMERFHEKSLKNELYYEMNQSAEPQAEQPQKDPVEESNGQYNKLTSFHAKISEKLLFEIFLTSSFNQLIQEIFKIKYHKLGETTCDHHILAR